MNNAQYTQLTSLCNIDLVGSGVTQFLDGQLTINTNSLETNTAKLACFCNHKGRIIALFHIMLIDNGVRLILPQSTIETAEQHIKKYSVFFKVEVFTNTTELFGIIQDTPTNLEHSDTVNIDQTDLLISFNESDLAKTDDTFWFNHLATKKIAWLTQDTLEHFLPHNLNLPALNAIDFNKGCFTGQEVIARMQYKGKLKQHLQLLLCEENIKILSKSKLFQNGIPVGEIVCSMSNCKNNVQVLALIKDSANLSQQFQTTSENSSILEIIS